MTHQPALGWPENVSTTHEERSACVPDTGAARRGQDESVMCVGSKPEGAMIAEPGQS